MRKISRREFVETAAVVSLAAHPWMAQAKGAGMSKLLLVGTQTSGTSKGIYAYSFDPAAGELKQTGLAAEADNPTFLALAPDGRTVIAANELDTYQGKKSGAVSSYTLDPAAAKLTKVNEVAAGGDATCHVAVDHTGHSAFAANYGGGSAVSFALGAGGRLSPPVSFEQYTGKGPNKDRQDMPHAHRVTVSPGNKFLLVNDLGLDQIHIYKLDAATGKLTPNDPPAWKANPGSGPRALRFHPNGKWAYCVNEINSTVNVLRWDEQCGVLETIQELSLSPDPSKGTSTASEVVLDHDGRFAYVANRGDNFVASFAVAASDGKLQVLEKIPCGGTTPRHIALDPDGRWLLVANQDSDNIAVLPRDGTSGRLTERAKSFPISKPQCLVFV